MEKTNIGGIPEFEANSAQQQLRVLLHLSKVTFLNLISLSTHVSLCPARRDAIFAEVLY
jgi:hypothetical protein